MLCKTSLHARVLSDSYLCSATACSKAAISVWQHGSSLSGNDGGRNLVLPSGFRLQQRHPAAHPWFMGRCLPSPTARPALARSRSVTKAFAARTACIGVAPFASSAAMADASVQPVPCVLPVLHRLMQHGESSCQGLA